MAAQIIPAPETAIVRQSQDLATQALAVKVANNEQRIAAAEMGKTIAAMQKQVDATFNPIIAAALASHRMALAKKAEVWEPLDRAKRYLAGCIGGYDQEQERKRRELQAELDRQQREREAVEAARLRREAEDRQLAEALAATEIGDDDLAEAIVSAPTLVELPPAAPVIVPSTVAQVAGASTRTTWKFRIVHAALIPRQYLAVDEVAIGGVVRALKGATSIRGVEVYEEAATSFRG